MNFNFVALHMCLGLFRHLRPSQTLRSLQMFCVCREVKNRQKKVRGIETEKREREGGREIEREGQMERREDSVCWVYVRARGK